MPDTSLCTLCALTYSNLTTLPVFYRQGNKRSDRAEILT